MVRRPIDPRRLGVEAFAREGGFLEGRWPLASFPRLMLSVHSEAPPEADASVVWQAQGEWRKPQSVEAQPWLHVRARTRLTLVCQRCLGPLDTTLEVDRWMRFVHGEEAAAALDAEIEDDVLALERMLDLHELVEDELILAMPLVPRHEGRCPVPLPLPSQEEEAVPEPTRRSPFAVLEALKRDAPPDGG